MTFFEYQITIAKIDSTNSYQALRRLHKKLAETFPAKDDFYLTHAINKTIKKFKSLTTSTAVRSKDYPEGTSTTDFNYAIQSAESKQQILLLLADFQGNKFITLPNSAQSLIHMANLGFTSNEPEFKQVHIKADYYSVGNDNDKQISETNRLPMSIICYLKLIESTELYKTLLSDSLLKAKHWNGTKLQKLLDDIDYQIDKQTKQITALQEAKLLYQELNDDTSGNLSTT